MPLAALTTWIERGEALSAAQAGEAMAAIADGDATSEDIVRFLRAYNRRAPTVEELIAFVTVLRERMVRVKRRAANTICNCGTGGDGRGTINVSTVAAFIIAAAGVPVAKHGNRSVSSRCGSTDCLTALGVGACVEPGEAEALLETEGLCFLNAPDFHPGVRHAAAARAILAQEGQRSVFNLLGPLLNPAGVRRQCVGVFAENLVQTVAEVLARTGTEFGCVVWGDGYDELTLTGATRMATIREGSVSRQTVEPESLGLARCDARALVGGDPRENARIGVDILSSRSSGAAADTVLLNAAAGISVGSMPRMDLARGLARAREAVKSGRAMEKLEALRRKAPARA